MEVDKQLNLVIPVDTEAGAVFVHSTPISRTVFELYFWEISKTFTTLVTELDSPMIGGPRIAALALRDVAQRRLVGPGVNRWNAPDGVERGLMSEIRRLTNAVMPSGSGWTVVPWQEVVTKRMMTEDDVAEVENAIVFFICTAAVAKKSQIAPSLLGMQQLWDVRPTSSSVTEFAAGLQTSTETASSGETVPTSSVPR